MKLFAVRDIKADSYGAPISVATRGLALRSFSDVCLDARSEIAKYPEDYSLHELGEYDPNSGVITPHPSPKHVASAVEMISAAKKGVVQSMAEAEGAAEVKA